MNADQLARLSTLLDAALALQDPQRETWLAALSGDDASLAPTLRRLLLRSAAVETDDLLERGPAFRPPAEAAAAPAFAAGDLVGPYRLLRPLGEGGMGEVWLAERRDGQLRREVALKLPLLELRRGVLVQRFARERDILAGLAHPNIARLYDAGAADDGQPYLALEYVQGRPITQFAAEHALDTRARVQLLLQVMAAVQFAHANLVIHRDIKPGNVLVTDAGQAMLLDFGIAKLLQPERGEAAETELTRVGGRALTMDYAAPEQISGTPVSTATDVYALGVLAYELLTGTRPFGGSRRELEQAILGAEPARPAGLPADLGTIVLKALKKAPAERYATVDAMADDLRRWLDGRAVLAQPDSAWYLTRKFVGRHRGAVAAAAGVLLTVLVAGAVSLRQAQLAREQARTAEAVQGFLEGILRSSTGNQADPAKARQRTAVELLDAGAARIDRELDDAPQAKLRVLGALVDMYEQLGLEDRTVQLREQRARLTAKVSGEGSPAHVSALCEWAQSLTRAHRDDEAWRLIEQAQALLDRQGASADGAARYALDIAVAQFRLYRSDPQGLPNAERAVAWQRGQPPSPDFVDALTLLGGMRHLARQDAAAVEALHEALSVAAQLPERVDTKLSPIYDLLSGAEMNLGHVAEGLALMRHTTELDAELVGPDSTDAVVGQRRLAAALNDDGQFHEALAVAHAARERVLAWPESPDKARGAPSVYFTEASAAAGLGRIDAALALLDPVAAVPGLERSYPLLAVREQALRAELYVEQGRYAAAEQLLQQAGQLLQAARLEGTPARGRLVEARLALLLAQGRAGAAAALAAEQARQGAPVSPRWQARIALALGDAAQAEALASQAQAGGLSRVDAIRWPQLQGQALLRLGRPGEALAVLQTALERALPVFDPQLSLELASLRLSLAQAQQACDQPAEARAQAVEAAAIIQRQSQVGPHHRRALVDTRRPPDPSAAGQCPRH